MNDLPVRLRDVTAADADMLDEWARSPKIRGEFNDFGLAPDDRAAIREALEKGPLRNEWNGEMIVERVSDGQPIGTVAWHAVHYGPPPKSRAWNIGISL
ncbi:MAG: GNAT family N-acetyltransferase, partial [Candidatus Limnocylindria bacterium]